MVQTYAKYLLKSVQGFQSHDIPAYAVSIQNEPKNNNPTYPTTTYTPQREAEVGRALRTLMDSNGFSNTKLIVVIYQTPNTTIITGIMPERILCRYIRQLLLGSVVQQKYFRRNKEVYFTECAGTIISDWWSDTKWYMDNVTGLMWNIALDGNGNPKLPGTDSCGEPGCRGVVQINSDGSWSVNQEFYAMAQGIQSNYSQRWWRTFCQTNRCQCWDGLGLRRLLRAVKIRMIGFGCFELERPVERFVEPTADSDDYRISRKESSCYVPGWVTTLWWFAPDNGNSFSPDNSTTPVTIPIHGDIGLGEGDQQPLGFFSTSAQSSGNRFLHIKSA